MISNDLISAEQFPLTSRLLAQVDADASGAISREEYERDPNEGVAGNTKHKFWVPCRTGFEP